MCCQNCNAPARFTACLYVMALTGLLVYFSLNKTIDPASAMSMVTEYILNNHNEDERYWRQSTKPLDTANESWFVDDYFEPILETFKNKTDNVTKNSFRSGSIPKIYLVSNDKLSHKFWKNSLNHIKKNECPHRCSFTDNLNEYNSSDAILIYLRNIVNLKTLYAKLPARDPEQPWIVFSNESPTLANHYNIPFKSLDGVFNRTMFYRRDADITFTHGFVASKKNASYLPSSWHVDRRPIHQLPFHQRKPVVAFISNCRDSSGRIEYATELGKHIPVDIFGMCGEKKCGGSRYVLHDFRIEKDHCLLQAAMTYKFYLSFENSICEDYVTEKLYNILYYPVVPVVLGGADYSKLLPPNSYINALQFTPRQLADHLQSISADQERFDSMLSWKEHYDVSTVGGERIYCQLCTRLHDPNFYAQNVYTDFHSWFVGKSNCKHFSAKSNTTRVLQIP